MTRTVHEQVRDALTAATTRATAAHQLLVQERKLAAQYGLADHVLTNNDLYESRNVTHLTFAVDPDDVDGPMYDCTVWDAITADGNRINGTDNAYSAYAVVTDTHEHAWAPFMDDTGNISITKVRDFINNNTHDTGTPQGAEGITPIEAAGRLARALRALDTTRARATADAADATSTEAVLALAYYVAAHDAFLRASDVVTLNTVDWPEEPYDDGSYGITLTEGVTRDGDTTSIPLFDTVAAGYVGGGTLWDPYLDENGDVTVDKVRAAIPALTANLPATTDE